MLALDSNILSAIFRGEETAESIVQTLELRRGDVVIHVAVFAEVLAGPRIQRRDVEAFLTAAEIEISWETSEAVWELSLIHI